MKFTVNMNPCEVKLTSGAAQTQKVFCKLGRNNFLCLRSITLHMVHIITYRPTTKSIIVYVLYM